MSCLTTRFGSPDYSLYTKNTNRALRRRGLLGEHNRLTDEGRQIAEQLAASQRDGEGGGENNSISNITSAKETHHE